MTRRTTAKAPKRRVGEIEEDAYVSLLRTADLLTRGVEQVMRQHEVSPTQYNVLRILRGTLAGLPCSEIGNRMITRDPDITRLVDRLEKRGLVSRGRDSRDRRVVLARITAKGLRLLHAIHGPMTAVHRHQLSHLGRKHLLTLLHLLEVARNSSPSRQG